LAEVSGNNGPFRIGINKGSLIPFALGKFTVKMELKMELMARQEAIHVM
jgi:hypothetical protein